MTAGFSQAAKAKFQKSSDVSNGGYALAHVNLGVLLLHGSQDLAGAISHCQRAIEADALCETAHVHMAHLLLQKADLAGAVASFDAAIALLRVKQESGRARPKSVPRPVLATRAMPPNTRAEGLCRALLTRARAQQAHHTHECTHTHARTHPRTHAPTHTLKSLKLLVSGARRDLRDAGGNLRATGADARAGRDLRANHGEAPSGAGGSDGAGCAHGCALCVS